MIDDDRMPDRTPEEEVLGSRAVGVERRKAVLETLVRVHPDESTRAGFKRDTCVFASWTGREVLRRFGIQAKPVAVRAIVANAIAWEAKDGDIKRIMDEAPPEGGWTLGLGVPAGDPAPGRWSGHLVLTARNPDVFLDLTIDQANRPEKGIVFEPHLEEVGRCLLREFEAGTNAIAFKSDSGARVVYAMIPDLSPASGHDWNAAGDVEIRRYRDQFVDRLEARIRRELEAS